MGKDQYENEELLKHGFEEDIWFHVDKYSSAHVYIRLNSGMTIDNLPPKLIEDCAQLVKANSIEGNKKNSIQVVYTPWSNLKKTQGMEIGQIGFHKPHIVKKINVEKRINEIVNRLDSTREEKLVDFAEMKINKLRKEREELKSAEAKKKLQDLKEQEEKKAQSRLKSYEDIFETQKMKTNTDLSKMNIEQYEDSFM